MKLEGKWYVSVHDDKQTSTYPDATELEIFAEGPWVRFKSQDGKIHVTSYPVNARTGSSKKSEGE